MTSREKYLTRLVENALGLQVTEDDNVDYTMGNQDDPNQLPNPASQISIPEGEEMVAKEPLPKYENIEKLMQEIEQGTNKAMYEYKMKRMMEIAEMLEAKVSSLEEGEHAEHIDKKAVNQMRKDIAALRKGEEKLRKEFDKKFNKKEKAAAPKAEKEVDAEKPTLQEGTFDLRKFLVENKMTRNSRLLMNELNMEDVPEAIELPGVTGPVTVVFHSEHGMDEAEVEVMDVEDALALIRADAAELDGAESHDIIINTSDIDQQGDYLSQTKGLKCVLEVAILGHGTYEVYQGAN